MSIIPFERIQEAYWENGFVCGQIKYVLYEKNWSGQIQFIQFAKCFWRERIGLAGYYQKYDQNGRVIREGYEKDSKYVGEHKLFLDNQIEYGKIIHTYVPLWY